MTVADPARWRPPLLIEKRTWRWGLYLSALLYLALALGSMDVDWERVKEGAQRGVTFMAAFLRPDFVSHQEDIIAGLMESLTMTLAATVLGVFLAIPMALGAAANMAPRPVYLVCRTIIALCRSFQEIILAIFFVAMFGFGPFAGLVTLIVATVGFFGKLLAEEIEAMDPAPVEAMRATGGKWLQVVNYGVQPQVMPRVIGLSLYRLDINFRESAVIGIVGGGGIGSTLNTAFDRYEFDTAAAILLLIIAIVMATEYFSGQVREWVR